MATTNSTSETAKENFITDHGSIRLRCSRARRGPRVAAPATVARALRTASDTRAAPTAAPDRAGVTIDVAPLVWRRPAPTTVVLGGAPAGMLGLATLARAITWPTPVLRGGT